MVQQITSNSMRPIETKKNNIPQIHHVAAELEAVRCVPVHDGVEFPTACRSMLYSLPGNTRCIDCDGPDASWASTSYGIIMCLQCSGRHRSYGVQVSRVRSVDMDAWSYEQVMAMLEGGNEQFRRFMERHRMGNNYNVMDQMTDKRYETKAALFYRSNLKKHVEQLASLGVYKGREAARRKYQSKQQIHKKVTTAATGQTMTQEPMNEACGQ